MTQLGSHVFPEYSLFYGGSTQAKTSGKVLASNRTLSSEVDVGQITVNFMTTLTRRQQVNAVHMTVKMFARVKYSLSLLPIMTEGNVVRTTSKYPLCATVQYCGRSINRWNPLRLSNMTNICLTNFVKFCNISILSTINVEALLHNCLSNLNENLYQMGHYCTINCVLAN